MSENSKIEWMQVTWLIKAIEITKVAGMVREQRSVNNPFQVWAITFSDKLKKVAVFLSTVARFTGRNDVAGNCFTALTNGKHMIPSLSRATTVCAAVLKLFQQILDSYRRDRGNAPLSCISVLHTSTPIKFIFCIARTLVFAKMRTACALADTLFRQPRFASSTPSEPLSSFQSSFPSTNPICFRSIAARSAGCGQTVAAALIFLVVVSAEPLFTASTSLQACINPGGVFLKGQPHPFCSDFKRSESATHDHNFITINGRTWDEFPKGVEA